MAARCGTTRRQAKTDFKQQPSAIILGCSDARVPVEIVFDQDLGDLFVMPSVEQLRHGSTILENLIRTDQLLVVGAEYSLETGRVGFFEY